MNYIGLNLAIFNDKNFFLMPKIKNMAKSACIHITKIKNIPFYKSFVTKTGQIEFFIQIQSNFKRTQYVIVLKLHIFILHSSLSAVSKRLRSLYLGWLKRHPSDIGNALAAPKCCYSLQYKTAMLIIIYSQSLLLLLWFLYNIIVNSNTKSNQYARL